MKDIEFNVLDSMNMKLQRMDPTGALKTGLQLFGGVSNVLMLNFTFQSFEFNQKLRGSLSYILQVGLKC